MLHSIKYKQFLSHCKRLRENQARLQVILHNEVLLAQRQWTQHPQPVLMLHSVKYKQFRSHCKHLQRNLDLSHKTQHPEQQQPLLDNLLLHLLMFRQHYLENLEKIGRHKQQQPPGPEALRLTHRPAPQQQTPKQENC
jgi:hypothetical protein